MYSWRTVLFCLVFPLASSIAASGCVFLNPFLSQHKLQVESNTANFADSKKVADGMVLDHRLIDQPAGDEYVNQRLWNTARCPIPNETAALLAENGIRVGVISGVIDHEFLARVTSEKFVVAPQALTTQPNETKTIALNGPIAQARINLVKSFDQPAISLEADDVECGLKVTVNRGKKQTTRSMLTSIRFAVQHGQKQNWLKPSDDKTQFIWKQQKSQNEQIDFQFEIDLEPSDYLIIGTTAEPANTLGELFFFVHEQARSRQRFFVLRGQSFEKEKKSTSQSLAAKVVSE